MKNQDPMAIINYYREHLAHVFGEERADRIIRNSHEYSDPLSESAEEGDEKTPFQNDLENKILPLIGLYRAMTLEGFTEKEVGAYIKALWDIAPDTIKNRART